MKIVAVFLASLFALLGCLSIFQPHVSAASADIVIMQLQTAGALNNTASQEYILLYNNSDADINITGWCLNYSSAGNGQTFSKISCATPPDAQTELWLVADGYASFASTEFTNEFEGFVPDFGFSAGIASDGGHIELKNTEGVRIDLAGWGGAKFPEGFAASPHAAGQVLSRDFLAAELDTDVNLADFSSQPILSLIISGVYEKEIIVDRCANIDGVQVEFPAGYLVDDNGDCYEDFCPNIDGLQLVAPDGYEKKTGSVDCTEVPLEDAVLFITELLPDAPSVDTGQEFIEIYNPNTAKVALKGYRLQLGPSFTKEFVFPDGFIEPGQYLTFSDTITGITLPNSTGQQLRLIAPAGNTVSESATYTNADDDVSWALAEDVWIFTNQITPAAANKPYLEPVVEEVLGVTSVLAPCPAGKFRNPETNRCKTIETAVSQLVPCNEDEFRNPDTNRCKKISSTGSTLSPCPAGQERNPETNRCRKVTNIGITDESDLPAITDLSVENVEGQINWLVISAALVGALGYMLYEWRNELSHHIVRMKQRLVQ